MRRFLVDPMRVWICTRFSGFFLAPALRPGTRSDSHSFEARFSVLESQDTL